MTIQTAIKLYKEAGPCESCFRSGIGKKPTTRGCRLPQPRYIGPQYWEADQRVVVCMVNPGTGTKPEIGFEKILSGFYRGTVPFYVVNEFIRDVMPKWGNGFYQRSIEKWMDLDLERIAIMNIALCPMVDTKGNNFYPEDALENCFERFTRKIIVELEPHITVLCGSTLKRFSDRIETLTKGAVVQAPHYAARLDLKQLRETYSKIREILHERA